MNLFIDLHMHTHASAHAYSSAFEYIMEAKRKNMLAIAITDHGPALDDSPHKWHFLNLYAIPERVDGIRILKGIEANIFKDGSIDCDNLMSEKLDFVMAGFHDAVYPPCYDVTKNTDCLIKVINNPSVKIIVHLGNPKFPVNYRAIATEAARNNVALEINSGSAVARKGSSANCREIIEEVKSANGYVSVGSDAHYCSQMGNFEHALKLLEMQKFPEKKIINSSLMLTSSFLEIKELLHW